MNKTEIYQAVFKSRADDYMENRKRTGYLEDLNSISRQVAEEIGTPYLEVKEVSGRLMLGSVFI